MLPKNGLLDRRAFLAGSAGLVSAAVWAVPKPSEPWRSGAGRPMSPYGAPSQFVALERLQIIGHPLAPEAGASSTPDRKSVV